MLHFVWDLEWYAEDYLIYDWCLANKKKINGKK